MSQSAREFFRDRVAGTLDTEKFARAQRQALLRDADDKGISEGEMEEAFGGDLHAAMSKAIAKGNQGSRMTELARRSGGDERQRIPGERFAGKRPVHVHFHPQ